MPRAVAIHQPNYLPWLGYFRKIAMADVFVFFDNVQMPRRKSYVSRNEVLTANGRAWLTVPIAHGAAGPGAIAETAIADTVWARKHLRTLEVSYAKAPFAHLVHQELRPILEATHATIADLNIALIRRLSVLLGLGSVEFVRATELSLTTGGGHSIPEILARTGATTYVTGRGAGTMRYLDPEGLAAQAIELCYVPEGYAPYRQLTEPFEPNLSIVDALLNCGPEGARRLLSAP